MTQQPLPPNPFNATIAPPYSLKTFCGVGTNKVKRMLGSKGKKGDMLAKLDHQLLSCAQLEYRDDRGFTTGARNKGVHDLITLCRQLQVQHYADAQIQYLFVVHPISNQVIEFEMMDPYNKRLVPINGQATRQLTQIETLRRIESAICMSYWRDLQKKRK